MLACADFATNIQTHCQHHNNCDRQIEALDVCFEPSPVLAEKIAGAGDYTVTHTLRPES